MTGPVTVTQADREGWREMKPIAEMVQAEFDAAIARARIEGAKMALEAAAKVAEEWRDENKVSAAEAQKQGNRGFAAELRTAATECNAFADHIRQIDPASLGAE